MSGTAATWHAAPRPALRRLATTGGPAGVILGRDHAGTLAPVPLLRPEPTRVALVGGSWLARLVVFRALAVGAFVEVITATPARWTGFGELAGTPAQLRVVPVEDLAASADVVVPVDALGGMQPVLHINDVGLAGHPDGPAMGPWHTVAFVLPLLTAHSAPVLADAQVVLLQRLGSDEAEVCVSTLRLPPSLTTKLEQLHDDMLVVAVGGVVRFLSYATTAIEEQLLGMPHRAERTLASDLVDATAGR